MYSLQTHVNGMLQESDMPSSASALYRNVRQKCVQMQIDKTNVSAAKRLEITKKKNYYTNTNRQLKILL